MTEFFDISQTLEEGLAVWPGDPEYRVQPVARISGGASANLTAIYMGTHTGTHIDAPCHIMDGAGSVADIPLEKLVGPARVIELPSERSIRAADLSSLVAGVRRLLLKTAPASPAGTAFEPGFVYLEPDAADFLADKGMLLVGTDAPSVDPFESIDLPAHHALLGHGVVLLEGIRLNGVPPGDYMLACLPLKVAGGDGAPARAVLWKD